MKRLWIVKATLAMALAAGSVSLSLAQSPVKLLNVSYDPRANSTRRSTPRSRRNGRRDRAGGHRRPVARRVGKQARAVIDGLEADVVTLALAYDIDAIHNVGTCSQRTGRRAAQRQRAPTPPPSSCRAQGQSQGHKGLERSRPAGRVGHHAESKDLRRRALELSRRLGLRAAKTGGNEAASGTSSPALQERAGARFGAEAPRRRSCSAELAMSHRMGKRGVARGREFGSDKVEIVIPSMSILAEPPVAVVDKVVEQAGLGRAEDYLGFLYTAAGQEIAARTSTGRARSRARKSAQKFPKSGSSRWMKSSAAGKRPRRPTSRTTASSTRSISRKLAPRRDRDARRRQEHPPGFRLPLWG